MKGYGAASYGDAMAHVYDAWSDTRVATERFLLKQIRSIVPPPAAILELGVGTGRMAVPLVQNGYQEAYSGQHYRSCETHLELQRSDVDQDR